LASSSAAGAIYSVSVCRRARVGQSFCVELAIEGGDALLNHGLELIVVDVRESDVQHFVRLRGERGEESVEEDCM
jgi:hypothetical protein